MHNQNPITLFTGISLYFQVSYLASMTIKIEKQFSERSERVKSVDLHPTEPWILTSLYSGTVCIWDYQSKAKVKSFKVSDTPVRSAIFIARKRWIVTGSDDTFIRVYDYDTLEKIKEIEAHTDYIRSLACHPTLPYVFSASDDKLVKVWDWENDWKCTQTFEGHSHYVMQVAISPLDTNTFASVSLDGTIKVWSLNSPNPSFTIDDAHGQKGINCVAYAMAGDKLCLITGADDHTVKVWDYETKNCVKTLEGHDNNVTAVSVHPEFPIIISSSEDGNIYVSHATTYELVTKLSYGFERVWAVASMKSSSKVVFGCDEGFIVVDITNSNK